MTPEVSEWPVLRQGKSGQPIVFLHGFMGSKEDWQPVMKFLSPCIECLAFDLPGHGENTERNHIPEMSEAIAELERQRTRLGISRWHVAGYSLGGRIALRYALGHQLQTSSLSIISASPGIEQHADRLLRQKNDHLWTELMMALSVDDFMAAWYDQPLFKSLEMKPDLLRRLKEKRSRINVALMSEVMRKWGQGTVPSAWDQLGSLTIPWQLVVGKDDQAYHRLANRVKNLFPAIQIAIVENAGHPVHEEQPAALATIMKNFIQAGQNI